MIKMEIYYTLLNFYVKTKKNINSDNWQLTHISKSHILKMLFIFF